MPNERKDRLLITPSKSFLVKIPLTVIDGELFEKMDGKRSIEHFYVNNPMLLNQMHFPERDMVCHFAPIPEDDPNGDTPTIVQSILEQYPEAVWPHPIHALMHLYTDHRDMLDFENSRYINVPNFNDECAQYWLDHTVSHEPKKEFMAPNGRKFYDMFVPVMQSARSHVSISIGRPSGIPWHGAIQFVFFTKK